MHRVSPLSSDITQDSLWQLTSNCLSVGWRRLLLGFTYFWFGIFLDICEKFFSNLKVWKVLFLQKAIPFITFFSFLYFAFHEFLTSHFSSWFCLMGAFRLLFSLFLKWWLDGLYSPITPPLLLHSQIYYWAHTVWFSPQLQISTL